MCYLCTVILHVPRWSQNTQLWKSGVQVHNPTNSPRIHSLCSRKSISGRVTRLQSELCMELLIIMAHVPMMTMLLQTAIHLLPSPTVMFFQTGKASPSTKRKLNQNSEGKYMKATLLVLSQNVPLPCHSVVVNTFQNPAVLTTPNTTIRCWRSWSSLLRRLVKCQIAALHSNRQWTNLQCTVYGINI